MFVCLFAVTPIDLSLNNINATETGKSNICSALLIFVFISVDVVLDTQFYFHNALLVHPFM